ncbi:uncharacterized protein [Argopecten irradians]|uniref:uncharacterized protein n=1 Tax=Argopecten irradians TaxID=31199 RepID=UPI0037147E0D
MDAYDKNTIDEDDDDDEDEPRSISSRLRLPTSRLASFTLFTTSGSSSTDGFTRIMVPLNANSLTISRRHFSRPVESLSVREIKDGQKDTSIPTPLPPHPVSRTASHEGQGQQQTNQTAEDIKMQIEVLQAKLEQMEKHNDNKGYQITENDMTCQSEISEEFKVVSKNPEENTTKNEINNTLQANETNEVPAKSDNPEIPISKLFKKHSYNKTEFNQEDFLNSLLSSPPLGAREGGLNVSQDMKFEGLKISNRNHQGPKQFSDEVINSLRSDSQWKENVNSDNEMEEDGVFENKFHEDITEVTLPLNPNIPHTRSLKTPGYEYERQDTWGATKSVRTDSKSDRDAVSPSGSNSPAIVPPGDSANPQNFPLLKYPDHSPTTGVHHATQLPPKRKSQEVPVDGNPNPVSEYDEDDIGYQEYNQSNRNTYSKGSGSSHYHSSPRYTSYMASLQSLADHNGYLIKDVTPDGNCMFSAIIDQLRIQGNFDLTPNSLRRTAVDYLRNNPKNQDGTHLESFLSTETWEEYLKRMGQESQWGDHMVLQACTEVTGQRIIVFKPNTNKTELVPTAQEVMLDYTITLGHIGESHFVSLRPTDWEATWPMKAHAHRARMKEKKKLARKRKLERQKSKEGKDQSPDVSEKGESTVDHEKETEVIEETEGATGETIKEKKVMEDEDDSGDEEEENNSQFKTTDGDFDLMSDVLNPVAIDATSGIPLPHLSFLLRQFVKSCYIFVGSPENVTTFSGTEIETYIAGSVADGLCIRLIDYSNRKQSTPALNTPTVIGVCNGNVRSESEGKVSEMDLIADTTLTRPGYVHLIPINTGMYHPSVTYIEGKAFVQHLGIVAQNKGPVYDLMRSKTFTGHKCLYWPECAMEWFSRYRPSGWPGNEINQKIANTKCIVMSRPHPQSFSPNIEYQFVFPKAEQILAKEALSDDQRNCFNAFKLLIDFSLRNNEVRLRTTHLKSVMYHACETIPQASWANNSGGCLLYLLDSLCEKLHARNIPNYFIHENNMVDHLDGETLQKILEYIDAIRTFPVMSFYYMTEHHDLSVIANMVLDDVPLFYKHRRQCRSVCEAFVPSVLQIAKSYFYNNKLQEGYEVAQEAYSEFLMQIPEEADRNTTEFTQGTKDAYLRFQKILQKLVKEETGDYRHFLAYHLDLGLGSSLMKELYEGTDMKTIGDLIGNEAAGSMALTPIPIRVYGNIQKELSYIDSCAYRLYKENNIEQAVSVLRAGIQKGHRDRESSVIDVSDIMDCNVKKDIAKQTYTAMHNRNCLIGTMYNHLYICYQYLYSVELFSDIIEDYEELCDMIGSTYFYKDVIEIWQTLGNKQRSDEAKRKLKVLSSSSEYMHDTWIILNNVIEKVSMKDKGWMKPEYTEKTSLDFTLEANGGLPLLSGCDIDKPSGIPCPHLQFFIRHLIPPAYIRTVELDAADRTILCRGNSTSVQLDIIGSVAEGLCVELKNFNENALVHAFKRAAFSQRHSGNTQSHVKLKGKGTVVCLVKGFGHTIGYDDFYLDTTGSYPGYIVMRPLEKSFVLMKYPSQVLGKDDDGAVYFKFDALGLSGLVHEQWPQCANDWDIHHNVDVWPGSFIVQQIRSTPCVLLSRSHPFTEQPGKEWQVTFPFAEILLAHALTPEMKSCFSLFKVIVDYHTHCLNCRLKTTHLKTVMYGACETLPVTAWRNSPAGCLLHLLDLLILRISSGVLANYFVQQNNMISHFSITDRKTLEGRLKALREFPLTALVLLADGHGIQYEWLSSYVFEDCERFVALHDITHTIEHAFIPSLVNLAKRRVTDGAYDAACTIMHDVYSEWSFEKYQEDYNSTERMERFFKRILRNNNDSSTLTLMNKLDKKFGTNLLSLQRKTGSFLTLKDIVGQYEAGDHADVFVGQQVKDNVISMIQYLDNYAFVQFNEGRLEDCAQFLRSAISKGKEYIQGGDAVKEYVNDFYWEHGERRLVDAYTIHSTLLVVFSHLMTCYTKMGQISLIQEYIDDFQESCDRTGGHFKSYLKLESLWRVLGNPKRADAIMQKLSAWEKEAHKIYQEASWSS